MSYAAVEVALQGLLQADARFGTDEVTRGDWTVLDGGVGRYVVLYPGSFRVRRSGDWSQVTFSWSTYAEVYEVYVGPESVVTLEASVQALVDVVGANPTLGAVAGVSGAGAVGGDDVQFWYAEGEREVPGLVMQRVRVEADEEVLYDGDGEFA